MRNQLLRLLQQSIHHHTQTPSRPHHYTNITITMSVPSSSRSDNKGAGNSSAESDMKWMYRGLSGHVDREEYLTGRKVDKTFDLIRVEEGVIKSDFDVDIHTIPRTITDTDHDRNKKESGAASASSSTVTGSLIRNFADADVAAKMKEDPLYLITKREMEKRKEILLNPVRIRRLQNLIQQTLSSSSDSDSSSSSPASSTQRHSRSHHSRHSDRRPDASGRHSDHKSDSGRRVKRKKQEKRSSSISKKRDKGEKKEKECRKECKSSTRHRKSRSRSPHRHSHRHHHRRSSSSDRREQEERMSKFRNKDKNQSETRRTKLTAAELERKRLEMESDAMHHEAERSNRVKGYRCQELREKADQADRRQRLQQQEERSGGSGGAGAAFVKPILKSLMQTESLTTIVKQKISSSQRSGHCMDSSFATRK